MHPLWKFLKDTLKWINNLFLFHNKKGPPTGRPFLLNVNEKL
jgi:hypothetical protein